MGPSFPPTCCGHYAGAMRSPGGPGPPVGRVRGSGAMGGGGRVTVERLSASNSQPTAPGAPNPLPALAGLTFRHSKTVEWGGSTISSAEIMRQGPGVAGSPPLHMTTRVRLCTATRSGCAQLHTLGCGGHTPHTYAWPTWGGTACARSRPLGPWKILDGSFLRRQNWFVVVPMNTITGRLSGREGGGGVAHGWTNGGCTVPHAYGPFPCTVAIRLNPCTWL